MKPNHASSVCDSLCFASLAAVLVSSLTLIAVACYSPATTPAILRGPRPGPTYCDPYPDGGRTACPNGFECVNRLCEAPDHIEVPYTGLAHDGGARDGTVP